jgi:hypothetical protein
MISSLQEIDDIRNKGYKAIANENARISNNSYTIGGSIGSNWSYLGQGRHRRVYKRGNVVLKIPLNLAGLEANIMEREIFLNRRNEDIFAPCRMLRNGCLMMRALDDIFIRLDLHPSWARALIDGPQIGLDKNGKVMIYDYAEEYYE